MRLASRGSGAGRRRRSRSANVFIATADFPDGRRGAADRSDSTPRLRRAQHKRRSSSSQGSPRRTPSDAPAGLPILADGTEPNTGSLVAADAQGGRRANLRGTPRQGRIRRRASARNRTVRIVPTVRMRFNPTRESSNLFVPGLMAFVLTIISSLMTAISLTREKETGTMEALLVSPLRPWEIIVGKVAPYLAIGFISVVAVLVEARLVFHVPLRGSVLLLLAEGVLFILVSLSLGILVSARTSSQRVAMMGALLGTMLPNMLLSGFIFPVESMPAAAARDLQHRARRAGSSRSRAGSCSRASASNTCGARR